MSKSDEVSVIFTHNNSEYRSTLEVAKKRGLNSVISIAKLDDPRSVYELYLHSIAPKTEIKIFNLISQGWWIDFKVEYRHRDVIRPALLRQFEYLVTRGLEEKHALRSIIVSSHLESSFIASIDKCMRDDAGEIDIEALFEFFSSLGVPLIYTEKDESNFEVFLTIALRNGIEIAKESIKSAGEDVVHLRNLVIGLNTLHSDSEGLSYIPKMCSPALKSIQTFRTVTNMYNDKNTVAILQFLSEVPESKWIRIEAQAELLRQRLPLDEHMDERDASLWVQNGNTDGMLDLMSRSTPFLAGGDQKIFCILMNRYGLETLIYTLDIFRNESVLPNKDLGAKFNDRFANLLTVANFIDTGGDPSTPITWMIEFSQNTDNDANEDCNLDALV